MPFRRSSTRAAARVNPKITPIEDTFVVEAPAPLFVTLAELSALADTSDDGQVHSLNPYAFGTFLADLGMVLWLKGVLSVGPVTDAQIAFMTNYTGGSLAGFPGAFVSDGGRDALASSIKIGSISGGQTIEFNYADGTRASLKFLRESEFTLPGDILVTSNTAFEYRDGNGVFVSNATGTLTLSTFINRVTGSAAADDLSGTTLDDLATGGAGSDLFRLQQGGNDQVSGGDGDDAFYFGGRYNQFDTVDGGAGFDQIGLQGLAYNASTTLGGLAGVEMIVLLPGNDLRFGHPDGVGTRYNLITVDANVGPGQVLIFQANTLRELEFFSLNGSAETDGSFLTFAGHGRETLIGGQQGDGFFFGTGRFGSTDFVDGQGGSDQLGLQGDFAGANALFFEAGQLQSVEFIVLLSAADTRFGGGNAGQSFSYEITMHDANVSAGQQIIIQANSLRAGETLFFGGFPETDGSFRVFGGQADDTIFGGQRGDILWGNPGADYIEGCGGADELRGGLGKDVFGYRLVSDSTLAARDKIFDFAAGDLIDLTLVDADSTMIGRQNFDLVPSAQSTLFIGQLRITQTGNVALVEGESNGDGQVDFAIEVTLTDGRTLGRADFTGLVAPITIQAGGEATLPARAPPGEEGAYAAWLWSTAHDPFESARAALNRDLDIY